MLVVNGFAHDLTALHSAVFGRLKDDLEGAPVRAVLGAGSASVIAAARLDARSLPPAPFLALQLRPQTRAADGTYLARYTWWVYDDPAYLLTRMGLLPALLTAAYATPLPLVPGIHPGRIDFDTVADGRIDPALGRYALSLPFTIYC